MANLVLAFGELLAGAIVLDAAIKGDSIANVVKGTATTHPVSGLDGAGGAPSSTPTGGAGGYVNPIPGFNVGRTDMGVDASAAPGTPILALGDSKVVGYQPNWFRGQPLIVYQLLNGPHQGKFWYVAEQITPTATQGQTVKAGQPVGHFAPSGTGIELGWAADASGRTLAQATTGYVEGQVTAAGKDFRNLLHTLGV